MKRCTALHGPPAGQRPSQRTAFGIRFHLVDIGTSLKQNSEHLHPVRIWAFWIDFYEPRV
jgi:hypothetical protein